MEKQERFTPMMDALTKLLMAKSIMERDGLDRAGEPHPEWPDYEGTAAKTLIATCHEIARTFDNPYESHDQDAE